MWRGYTEENLRLLSTEEIQSLLVEHGFSEDQSWPLDIEFIRCATDILVERDPQPLTEEDVQRALERFWTDYADKPLLFPEVVDEVEKEMEKWGL